MKLRNLKLNKTYYNCLGVEFKIMEIGNKKVLLEKTLTPARKPNIIYSKPIFTNKNKAINYFENNKNELINIMAYKQYPSVEQEKPQYSNYKTKSDFLIFIEILIFFLLLMLICT